MKFYHLNITSFKVIRENKASNYSKFQHWIAKVFKITPDDKRYFLLEATVTNAGGVCRGDIVKTADNNQWHISDVKKESKVVVLNSLFACYNPNVIGQAIVMFSPISE